MTVLGAVVKFFGGLKNAYVSWCRKHSFHPLIFAGIIIACLVALIIVPFIGNEEVPVEVVPEEGKTTKLELKDIGELATQVGYYTNVQVIREAQEAWGWEIPLTQTECIFSFDGIIKAGYNFEQIEIEVDEEMKTVTIVMPEPYVLSNEINPESLKIYDEDKNLFTPLSIEDFGGKLEQVRDESEADAIAKGLFDNARVNAEALIRGFLSGMIDLDEYEIIFVDKEISDTEVIEPTESAEEQTE